MNAIDIIFFSSKIAYILELYVFEVIMYPLENIVFQYRK